MGELIPECNWPDLVKIVEQGKIEELKSCEVKFNSKIIFYAIIPHGDWIAKDFVKTKAEYLGVNTNISGGVNPEDIMAVPSNKYANLVKARAARKGKREKNLA